MSFFLHGEDVIYTHTYKIEQEDVAEAVVPEERNGVTEKPIDGFDYPRKRLDTTPEF